MNTINYQCNQNFTGFNYAKGNTEKYISSATKEFADGIENAKRALAEVKTNLTFMVDRNSNPRFYIGDSPKAFHLLNVADAQPNSNTLSFYALLENGDQSYQRMTFTTPQEAAKWREAVVAKFGPKNTEQLDAAIELTKAMDAAQKYEVLSTWVL